MTILLTFRRVQNPSLVSVVPTELFVGKRDNDFSAYFSPGSKPVANTCRSYGTFSIIYDLQIWIK